MKQGKSHRCCLCIFVTLILSFGNNTISTSEAVESASATMVIATELMERQFGSEESWLNNWLLIYRNTPSGAMPTDKDTDLFSALRISIDTILKLGIDNIESIDNNLLNIGFFEFADFQMRFWQIEFMPINQDATTGTCCVRIDALTGIVNAINPGGRQIESYNADEDFDIKSRIDQWTQMAPGGLDSWTTYNHSKYPGDHEVSLYDALGLSMKAVLSLTGYAGAFFYHVPFNLLYSAEEHVWQIGLRFSSPPESVEFNEVYYFNIDSLTGEVVSISHSLDGEHTALPHD